MSNFLKPENVIINTSTGDTGSFVYGPSADEPLMDEESHFKVQCTGKVSPDGMASERGIMLFHARNTPEVDPSVLAPQIPTGKGAYIEALLNFKKSDTVDGSKFVPMLYLHLGAEPTGEVAGTAKGIFMGLRKMDVADKVKLFLTSGTLLDIFHKETFDTATHHTQKVYEQLLDVNTNYRVRMETIVNASSGGLLEKITNGYIGYTEDVEGNKNFTNPTLTSTKWFKFAHIVESFIDVTDTWFLDMGYKGIGLYAETLGEAYYDRIRSAGQ